MQTKLCNALIMQNRPLLCQQQLRTFMYFCLTLSFIGTYYIGGGERRYHVL